jgi:hypothetical protein
MADLDDGPDQTPLPVELLQKTAAHLLLLDENSYNLILTHGPQGEYTRHRRHAECSRTIVELWRSGALDTQRLLQFAYEDGDRAYLPRVRQDADLRTMLPHDVWLEKRRLLTDTYGFRPDSWEARSTPREEGFWCFDSAPAAGKRPS